MRKTGRERAVRESLWEEAAVQPSPEGLEASSQGRLEAVERASAKAQCWNQLGSFEKQSQRVKSKQRAVW